MGIANLYRGTAVSYRDRRRPRSNAYSARALQSSTTDYIPRCCGHCSLLVSDGPAGTQALPGRAGTGRLRVSATQPQPASHAVLRPPAAALQTTGLNGRAAAAAASQGDRRCPVSSQRRRAER